MRAGPPKLSVGILAADAMNFGAAIELLERFGALVHLDVMDGRVWPRITAGSSLLAGLRTRLLKDVHLLVERPEKHIEDFAKAGADLISFSVEHCRDVAAALDLIGALPNANDPQRGILRGASLDPATPVEALAPVADRIDVVVLLAVGPTTGKQDFIAGLPDKISAVRQLRSDILVFVDGAVTKENIGRVAAMGPNAIVTGSAAFAGDAAENIRYMLEQIRG
ncbi:MAG: ribulose-phosphate 3-epimerase [Planctomycetota bacterium]|nr:MAG: ribulose-phosphate 3-epimerase [Planctomycetota bacterium]